MILLPLAGRGAVARSVVPKPPCYTFRVRLPRRRRVSRDIELAANQTLADLGDMIPTAFGFWDEHLWSFFLSGIPWDESTEYAGPHYLWEGEPDRAAERVRIRDLERLGVEANRDFLFVFDYGDEWHFRLKLVGICDQLDPGGRYPRIVDGRGEAPSQYPSDES